MEVLTTVQTIAEDQTEVASKMNTLLSEYQIRTDDIKAYDIATFGANRFLISVVYILTLLQRLSNIRYALRANVVRIVSLKKKLSSRFKLGTKAPGFIVGFVRSPIATIAFIGPIITIISEKVKYIRRPSVILNLVSGLFELIRYKRKQSSVIGIISKRGMKGIGVTIKPLLDLVSLNPERKLVLSRSLSTITAFVGPIITVISEIAGYVRKSSNQLQLITKLGNLKIGKVLRVIVELDVLCQVHMPIAGRKSESLILFNNHWDAYYNGVPIEL